MQNLIEDCSLVKVPMGFNRRFYDDVWKNSNIQKIVFEEDDKTKSRFWVDLKYRNPKTGEDSVRGKVKIQIDVLPKE